MHFLLQNWPYSRQQEYKGNFPFLAEEGSFPCFPVKPRKKNKIHKEKPQKKQREQNCVQV